MSAISEINHIEKSADCEEPYRIGQDLTIVIPAFRCAPFLHAAIQSALHARPAMVLVSTDGCGLDVPRVAEIYARDFPDRVRVLHRRRNRGAAANVNRALDYVQTPFFAKLDGDDVLVPGHLEAAFPLISARPSLGILAGHERRIATNDMLLFDPGAFPEYTPDPAPLILAGTAAFRFIVEWSPNPCSSGCIYRTEAFREIGGFDEAIRWGEDWEIWLRFAARWEVGYCAAPSALYRIHPHSTTALETQQDRLCVGYDAVYRRAAELCHDPQIAPLLRRSFLRVAGLYGKAAVRQTLALRPRAVRHWFGAARALGRAFAPRRHRVETSPALALPPRANQAAARR